MSVSLLEVIEGAGYNINDLDDAIWLLSKEQEFNELLEHAQEVIDEAEQADDDYFKDMQEDR